MKPEVTLDRVALMCAADASPDEVLSGFGGFDDSAAWRGVGREDTPVRSVSWKFGTVHLTATIKVVPHLSGEFVPARGEGAEWLRVEYNPNKVDWADVAALWPVVQSARATRLDVAIDYPDVALGDYVWQRSRTATSAFMDAARNQEGFMLGRRGSARHLVVYDKGKELGRDDLLVTRCEMRQSIKPADVPLGENLFAGVRAYRSAVPSHVTPHEAAYLLLRMHAPDKYRQLAKGTRRTYDALAESVQGELQPHPKEVYGSARGSLLDQVGALLSGRPVPRASVYTT